MEFSNSIDCVLPVSVVVPIFNEADTLEEFLTALRLQTALAGEILFVDAGSSDQGPMLIRQWWDNNGWPNGSCRVIAGQALLPGAARNEGIKEARYPWIAFLDGGVAPSSQWLESLFDCVQRQSLEYAFGTCYFTAQDSLGRAVCALSYGYGNSLNHALPGSLFHRNVLEKVGLFPVDLRWGEDLVWRRRLYRLYKGPHVACPQALVLYRHFPDSWPAIAKKWFFSNYHVAAKGVSAGRMYFWIGVLLVIVICIIGQYFKFFIGASVCYGLIRGILDPIRRSRSWYWWKGDMTAFFLALIVGVFIDGASLLGALAGFFGKKTSVVLNRAS